MFFWVEQLFCFFFVVELVIRFIAFSNKCKYSREFWFLFDVFLVMSMVIQACVRETLTRMHGARSSSSSLYKACKGQAWPGVDSAPDRPDAAEHPRRWSCKSLRIALTWQESNLSSTVPQSDQAGSILGNSSVIRVARLLRLSRLLRMSQLLHLIPEVLILVNLGLFLMALRRWTE